MANTRGEKRLKAKWGIIQEVFLFSSYTACIPTDTRTGGSDLSTSIGAVSAAGAFGGAVTGAGGGAWFSGGTFFLFFDPFGLQHTRTHTWEGGREHRWFTTNKRASDACAVAAKYSHSAVAL